MSATSRPPAASRAPWIAGPWIDLAFFIGVPLFLVPLILARPGRPPVQELLLYLGAFGALGHHLPGMMRAYGDRELFQRYRWRFVLAPLFLATVCVGFTLAGLGGVVLITFFWTTWHTLMQIFGFARIYQAKNAQVAPARRSSRIDQLLCIGWIGAPLAYSDSRVGYILELYYRCGGPLIPEAALDLARRGWIAATLAITAVFLLDLFVSWRAGVRPNPVKLGFLAVSFGFWWFCMAAVDHLVVGIALFDVFHDVQYLALVWLFQRRRVAAGEGVTGFTRFLFRRSGGLIGLYVGLVVAYGSIGYFTRTLSSETTRQVVLGLLAASALYHFYLDGFIWKVRERSTRASLGLEGGGDTPLHAPLGWTRHGAKWALFVVPLVLVGWAEATSERDEPTWRAAVARTVPHSAEALTSWAAGLIDAGESERAAALCRQAIVLKPAHAEAHHNLGAALRTSGQLEEAAASFAAALRLRPDYAEAHEQRASVMLALGRRDEAERHYRAALASDPRLAAAHANLGALLYARGAAAEAVVELRAALESEPDHTGALSNLAWILATSPDRELRDPHTALDLAERLDLRTGQRVPQALHTLAAALAANGRSEEAVQAADRALALATPELAGTIAEHRALFQRGRALGD